MKYLWGKCLKAVTILFLPSAIGLVVCTTVSFVFFYDVHVPLRMRERVVCVFFYKQIKKVAKVFPCV